MVTGEWAAMGCNMPQGENFLGKTSPKLLVKDGLQWGAIAGILKIYHHCKILLCKGLQWVATGVFSINYPPEQKCDIKVDRNWLQRAVSGGF